MIFVTVGTEKFPFDRLIKIVDTAIKDRSFSDEVFMQIATSGYKPKNCPWKRFIEFNEMIDFIKKARITITHAGVGTLLLSLTLNKIPLLFPRDKKYDEHLDDHQIELAETMEQEGRVLVAYDQKELLNKIQNYDSLMRQMTNMDNNRKFKEDLVSYLTKLLS